VVVLSFTEIVQPREKESKSLSHAISRAFLLVFHVISQSTFYPFLVASFCWLRLFLAFHILH
jgi:hypothetical protein